MTTRKLPEWMMLQKASVVITSSNDVLTKTNKKRFFFDDEIAIKKRKPKEMSMVTYDGKIQYLSDFDEISEACYRLFVKVEKMLEKSVPVAFDMEWNFSFVTGNGKTALIQLCIDLDECFLFHLIRLDYFPTSLEFFLSHPKVVLHGVNIKEDLKKLEKDFPDVKTGCMIDKCIELGTWYNKVFNGNRLCSLKLLAQRTLRLNMDKSCQKNCEWQILPLTEHQKNYAAIDVYIGQRIFYHIKQKVEEDAENDEHETGED